MHDEAARKLIQDTFNQPYDLSRFRTFIRELTKGYDERETSAIVPDSFEDSIKSVYRIGTIKDSSDQEIDLLAVTLAKDTSLERARTMQRNFLARHLSKRNKDAALVAFVSPDDGSWRFSLVRRELSLTKNLKGKTKALQNFSPARRFSFLVGSGERTYTVKRQLLKFLTTDDKPTLRKLEEAFNIETVTDEFFEEYRELFNRVNDAITKCLSNNNALKNHFAEKDIESADFAKRLLGQIVFLYFLQKKGWLGVPSDGKWGDGSPTFLRDLYQQAEKERANFFDKYLKHLFYEALNRDHSDNDHYHSLFNSRIPFLNGGLFEPYHDYEWSKHDIALPNSIFHELGSSLFGEDGTGILDVFDRYNFTVAEDEPLEREVAIDPEMLGKVFERLLPVKERGKLGTFYTPREIVHYMCQESLIAYLGGKFPAIDKGELEDFIRYGDLLLEHDAKVLRDGPTETYKDVFLGETIRDHLPEVDAALKTVKVCDPAIGSGAFPVGMMAEIVRARKVLALHMRKSDSLGYELKRETIQDCLYGVDLDPGAIEIAKLRLWLSLVVDEDSFDNIQALPNLDYKIMQGNSLLQTFESIKLFDDSVLKTHDNAIRRKKQLQVELETLQTTFMTLRGSATFAMSPKQKQALEDDIKKKKKEIAALESSSTDKNLPLLAGQSRAVELAEQLKVLHADFFRAARPAEKKKLKAAIEDLEWRLLETSMREIHQSRADTHLEKIKELQRANVKPYFLWKLHFSEVFSSDQNGFDIVIGNPPYGADIDDHIEIFERDFPNTTRAFKDIYKIFFELSIGRLINQNGTLAFITPNTYISQPRYKDLREYLLNELDLQTINLGEGVFDAVVPTAICIATRNTVNNPSMIKYCDLSSQSKYKFDINKVNFSTISKETIFENSDLSFYAEKQKFLNSVPLKSVIAFKDAGINYQRVKVGLSEKGKSDLGQRLLYEGPRESEEDIEYYKGADIDAFWIKKNTGRFVRISTIRNLKSNERVILNSDYFSKIPKVIWRQTAEFPIAAIDRCGIWFGRSIQSGVLKEEYSFLTIEYIVALLNSELIRSIYLEKVKEGGRVFPQVKLEKLKDLPVKIPNQEDIRTITSLVTNVEAITSSASYAVKKDELQNLLQELNNVIYKVYKDNALIDISILSDGAWARTDGEDMAFATHAQLAAIIKLLPKAMPVAQVRLAALYALEPRYLTARLSGADLDAWMRLVGVDATLRTGNVAAFAPRIDAAWGRAQTQLMANNVIVEKRENGSRTWSAGTAAAAYPTQGTWQEGRAWFVLNALKNISFADATSDLPAEDQNWITANAA